MALAGWLLFGAGPLNALDRLPSLAVIKAGYLDNITSIHSLEYDYENRWEVLEGIPDGILPPGGDPTVLRTGHYAQSGRKIARRDTSHSRSGNSIVDSWFGYDGVLFRNWRESRIAEPGQYQLPQGKVGSVQPSGLRDFNLAHFMGTLLGKDGSLGTLLEHAGVTMAGLEPIGGIDCIRLEIPAAAWGASTRVYGDTTVWIAPQHGYLPRKTLFRGREDGTVYGYFETLDYQVVTTPENRKIWLPRSGLSNNHGCTQNTLVVTNTRVNHPIDDAVFEVSFPVGTYVAEEIPGQPRKLYHAGGDEGQKRYFSIKSAEAVVHSRNKDEALVVQRRQRTQSSMAWMAGTGLSLLGIALAAWKFRRRR
jgi:hypothetical protein